MKYRHKDKKVQTYLDFISKTLIFIEHNLYFFLENIIRMLWKWGCCVSSAGGSWPTSCPLSRSARRLQTTTTTSDSPPPRNGKEEGEQSRGWKTTLRGDAASSPSWPRGRLWLVGGDSPRIVDRRKCYPRCEIEQGNGNGNGKFLLDVLTLKSSKLFSVENLAKTFF